MTDPVNAPGDKASFPPGLNNAFIFATFNALSFPLVVGSPMVLYAKSLGASATVLGIIAGMMPLLVIFQIPAASHVTRVGYKRFVFAGWGMRVMFIFAMALVPLAGGFLNHTTQLALLLMLLFAFNLSRGISSCAWLPWITSLLPASLRGRFLAVEAACVNLSSFTVFLLAAFTLGGSPPAWRFAALFAFSALMGVASLVFLKRIPEVSTPAEVRTSTTAVPWLEIAGYRPFRKLLLFNLGWSLAYGGLSAFTVAYLKVEAGMTERDILLVTSVAFLGGLGSLAFLGRRLDHFGSKPVLTACMVAWFLIAAAWFAFASHAATLNTGLLLALQIAMGMSVSLVNMANTRLAMATIPVMGRNHFFALFSVVSNLTLGLSPVLWGLMIDALQSLHWRWHAIEFNRYSCFFIGAALMFAVALAFCRRLEEPQAVTMEKLLRDVLIDSPLRVWVRLWPRA
jgi:MFS family permease